MRRRGPARVWDKLTDKAVRFTPQISPDVVAVHLFDLDRRDDEWRAAGLNPPPLMLRATCRLIYGREPYSVNTG